MSCLEIDRAAGAHHCSDLAHKSLRMRGTILGTIKLLYGYISVSLALEYGVRCVCFAFFFRQPLFQKRSYKVFRCARDNSISNSVFSWPKSVLKKKQKKYNSLFQKVLRSVRVHVASTVKYAPEP